MFLITFQGIETIQEKIKSFSIFQRNLKRFIFLFLVLSVFIFFFEVFVMIMNLGENLIPDPKIEITRVYAKLTDYHFELHVAICVSLNQSPQYDN